MKYPNKINTKITNDQLELLEGYMKDNRRNKCDAIRLLLERALEMETELQKLTELKNLKK